MMTSTIRKFGVGVASLALVASMAAPAFAADDEVLPGLGAANAGRLSGADRIGTSLKVADHAFSKTRRFYRDGKWELVRNTDKPTTVYITNADDAHLIDATTAGKLTDGPIVFVKNNSYVAEAVGTALKDETGKSKSFGAFNKVVAIGGEGSISDATLKLVAKKAGVAKTDRIAGKDRYETAVKIAEYIYNKAMNREDGYQYNGLLNNTNLTNVYIANGADGHLVDSMAGGVLDNGPTLLAGADGSLSEETQAFIKKTLPEKFIALGGEKAVSDKTVNDAWLIKALKNDWTESSDIPTLKRTKDHAKFLLDGVDGGTSRNPASGEFMGLKKAVSKAVQVRDVWSTSYQRVRLNANEAFAKYLELPANSGLEPSEMIRRMMAVTVSPADALDNNTNNDLKEFVANLILLYGDAITDVNSDAAVTSLNDLRKANLLKGAFTLRDGKVTGFDFGSFESFPAIADKISDAEADILQWWGLKNVDADDIRVKGEEDKLSYIAIASQKESDTDALNTKWNGNGSILNAAVDPSRDSVADQKHAASAPLAAVKEVSAWVAEEVKKNRDAKQAEFEAAAQALRDGLDKVAPKTVLRLGGKDRYETSAYIATQFMKYYTNVAERDVAAEFYVANGMAYADAIVAGQLWLGPVLLVPAEGDIPAAVVSTASTLPAWNKQNYKLDGYGIGGTKVLPEEQLIKVVQAANKNALAKEVDDTVSAAGSLKLSSAVYKTGNHVVVPVKVMVGENQGKKGKLEAGSVAVMGSVANKPTAAVDSAATDAVINVTVNVGTTPFGTYEIAYKYNGKLMSSTFKYELGTTTATVNDSDDTTAAVKYEVGAAYNGYDVKAMNADGTYKSGVTISGSGAKVASGEITHDTASQLPTGTLLALLKNGEVVKVFKVGNNVGTYTTPTLELDSASPKTLNAQNTINPTEYQKLGKFSNWSTLQGELGAAATDPASYEFTFSNGDSDPGESPAANVKVTEITNNGEIKGYIKNVFGTNKKFKIKAKVTKASDNWKPSTASADLEVTSDASALS